MLKSQLVLTIARNDLASAAVWRESFRLAGMADTVPPRVPAGFRIQAEPRSSTRDLWEDGRGS